MYLQQTQEQSAGGLMFFVGFIDTEIPSKKEQ